MYKIEQIRVSQIHTIVSLCERTQFPYHEYSFLDNSQLSDYFYNRITKSLIKEDSIALAISEGSKFKGMICCVKDDFDSNIFGFGCYRIEDILVFSSKIGEVKQITDKLITTVEENLISKSTPVYITLSLNNNLKNVDYLFNALTSNHFYYIHTLVTFYSKKKTI